MHTQLVRYCTKHTRGSRLSKQRGVVEEFVHHSQIIRGGEGQEIVDTSCQGATSLSHVVDVLLRHMHPISLLLQSERHDFIQSLQAFLRCWVGQYDQGHKVVDVCSYGLWNATQVDQPYFIPLRRTGDRRDSSVCAV